MTKQNQQPEIIEIGGVKYQRVEEKKTERTPAEEGFKRIHGYYPNTGVDDYGRPYDMDWRPFRIGYNAAQEDYKVGEYQEPVPEEEHKTLYDILRELDKPMLIDDVCSAVKRWIFQYDCDYATCEEYLEGYQECQTVLEERIK